MLLVVNRILCEDMPKGSCSCHTISLFKKKNYHLKIFYCTEKNPLCMFHICFISGF